MLVIIPLHSLDTLWKDSVVSKRKFHPLGATEVHQARVERKTWDGDRKLNISGAMRTIGAIIRFGSRSMVDIRNTLGKYKNIKQIF